MDELRLANGDTATIDTSLHAKTVVLEPVPAPIVKQTFTLKDYLASEVTQTRVLIAIKATLDSIGARKRLGCAISNEKAATVLTAVVLEALAPQLPPDGPGGGEEVPSEEVKAA